MPYLGIVSRRRYFGVCETGGGERGEIGQWRKKANQSDRHISDRQKHFYGKAVLTAEGALTSAVSGFPELRITTLHILLKSYLFFYERNTAV